MTPQERIARRAAEGARAALQEAGRKRAATAERDVRGRMRRAPSEAELALRNLRADITAGLPPAALLERIDDVLYRLKQKGRP